MSENKMESILLTCLGKYGGGELFFSNLDKMMQNTHIVDLIMNMVNTDINEAIRPLEHGLVVSSKFGKFFLDYYDREYIKLHEYTTIIVNGNLRNDEPIVNLEYLAHKIKGKDFIFIDDSFYSGKTRNVIKSELQRLGGRLVHTYVAYDGCPIRDKNVSSLYRYYDHFTNNSSETINLNVLDDFIRNLIEAAMGDNREAIMANRNVEEFGLDVELKINSIPVKFSSVLERIDKYVQDRMGVNIL